MEGDSGEGSAEVQADGMCEYEKVFPITNALLFFSKSFDRLMHIFSAAAGKHKGEERDVCENPGQAYGKWREHIC